MLAIALSLVACACWGSADFAGGLVTKRASVIGVLLCVEGVGLVLVVVGAADLGRVAAADRRGPLRAGRRRLRRERARLLLQRPRDRDDEHRRPDLRSGAALPVLVGVVTGDALSALVAVGLVVTMAGVILASLEATVEEETRSTRAPRG